MQIFLRVWRYGATNHRNLEMIYSTAFCDSTMATAVSWIHSNHSNILSAILYSLVFYVRCDNMRMRKVLASRRRKLRKRFLYPRVFPFASKECNLIFKVDTTSKMPESGRSFHPATIGICSLQSCRRFYLTTQYSVKAELQKNEVFGGKVYLVLTHKHNQVNEQVLKQRFGCHWIETSALHLEPKKKTFHVTAGQNLLSSSFVYQQKKLN